jgi:hypothetical protein
VSWLALALGAVAWEVGRIDVVPAGFAQRQPLVDLAVAVVVFAVADFRRRSRTIAL